MGWRAWQLRRVGGVLTLGSLTRPDTWPPGEVMEARCTRHRGTTALIQGCTCGLYAAASAKDLARTGVLNPAVGVVGAIAMWGTVVEHQRGARSRFAYPARLRLACGPCLHAGAGAVDPLTVVDRGGTLTALCSTAREVRRWIRGARGPDTGGAARHVRRRADADRAHRP